MVSTVYCLLSRQFQTTVDKRDAGNAGLNRLSKSALNCKNPQKNMRSLKWQEGIYKQIFIEVLTTHPHTSTPTKIWINSFGFYDFLSVSDQINKHNYVLLHYPSIQIVRKGRNKQQEVGLKICFKKLLLFHTTYL